jgi:hypothetical protein
MGEPEEPDRNDFEDLWSGDVPCCTGCGRPYRPGQNYCEHCGTGVGQWTPYIPYVNIPFNYRPFGDLWAGLSGREHVGWGRRIFYFLLYLLYAPIILAVACPFVIVEWWRTRKTRREEPPRSGEAGPRD